MATRTISLSEAAAKYRRLGRTFWPTVMRGARVGAERARTLMVERSRREAFDRGGYARSWKSTTGERSVTVYNSAPHAAIIEHGRRPGSRQPPTKALVPWVRRKLGVGNSEAKGIAFLVARKIGRDGIRGKLIMARARGAVVRVVLEEIRASLRRALGEV